jgi:hypothetical protein
MSGPSGRDVGPSCASSASIRKNVGPSRAPAGYHTCQMVQAHCYILQKTSSLPWVVSCPSKRSSHLQGVIPLRSISAKASWWGRPSAFFMKGLIMTSSCLCHPSNHLMGSSSPWRSELIISPCVPVLWYLSAGYGPAHQKLRPPWAHES